MNKPKTDFEVLRALADDVSALCLPGFTDVNEKLRIYTDAGGAGKPDAYVSFRLETYPEINVNRSTASINVTVTEEYSFKDVASAYESIKIKQFVAKIRDAIQPLKKDAIQRIADQKKARADELRQQLAELEK